MIRIGFRALSKLIPIEKKYEKSSYNHRPGNALFSRYQPFCLSDENNLFQFTNSRNNPFRVLTNSKSEVFPFFFFFLVYRVGETVKTVQEMSVAHCYSSSWK